MLLKIKIKNVKIIALSFLKKNKYLFELIYLLIYYYPNMIYIILCLCLQLVSTQLLPPIFNTPMPTPTVPSPTTSTLNLPTTTTKFSTTTKKNQNLDTS